MAQRNLCLYDIETGPLPEGNLQPLFEKTEKEIAQKHAGNLLDEFDPKTVKYGNLKDDSKRTAKLKESQELFEAKQDGLAKSFNAERDTAWEKFQDKAALSPLTGQILHCSFIENEPGEGLPGAPYFMHQRIDLDERALIAQIWQRLEERVNGDSSYAIVGFNNHGFDNPMLVNRSRILNVPIPSWFQDYRGFWSPHCYDLMKMWHHGQKGFIKLNDLCKSLGIPGKVDDVDGSDFAKLFNGTPEERAAAMEYCQAEMLAMWGLAIKMQLY